LVAGVIVASEIEEMKTAVIDLGHSRDRKESRRALAVAQELDDHESIAEVCMMRSPPNLDQYAFLLRDRRG
jgi:hypothetical protein